MQRVLDQDACIIQVLSVHLNEHDQFACWFRRLTQIPGDNPRFRIQDVTVPGSYLAVGVIVHMQGRHHEQLRQSADTVIMSNYDLF